MKILNKRPPFDFRVSVLCRRDKTVLINIQFTYTSEFCSFLFIAKGFALLFIYEFFYVIFNRNCFMCADKNVKTVGLWSVYRVFSNIETDDL